MQAPMASKTQPAARRETVADILLRQVTVPPAELQQALIVARETGQRLELVLATQGLVTESDMTIASASYLRMPAISLAHFTPDRDLLVTLPRRLVVDLHTLPLAKWGSQLAVAIGDPFDVNVYDELRALVGEEVVLYVAPRSQITELTGQCGHLWDDTLADALRDVSAEDQEIRVGGDMVTGEEPSQEEILSLSAQEPVIRIVNTMLIEAMERRASDIHIEPMEHSLVVRYRIDGVLYDQPSPPQYMQWAIISRLKIIAHIDIAQRLAPQDGRFSIRAAGREADVRLSLISTVHGQKAVLRILDKRNLRANLAALALAPHDNEVLQRTIREAEGIILVTGPTGSGKTTTLYSILQELNEPGVNIITIEDPVEYRIPRINQIPTNPDVGVTFASGLRAILRQDPDIIMVGEIRDMETAGIAVQSALTGHLVLSTLHTNDAAGAVARLVQMGVEPFLIASSLLLAQAQRVYRRLCRHCRRPSALTTDSLVEQGLLSTQGACRPLWEPAGCPRCFGIGYQGRQAVMELLQSSSAIQSLIMERASTEQIRDQARKEGMRTLREAGLRCVCDGDTSLTEVLRVTSAS